MAGSIQPSAWKGNSQKSNFRFTQFSEVRQKLPEQNCISALTFIADSSPPALMGVMSNPLWGCVMKEVALMKRILSLVTVALVMAAMMLASAMPALATHECTKDNRAGIQHAAGQGAKIGQGSFGLAGSVCYNAGGSTDFDGSPDFEDPGNVQNTPATNVD